MSLSNYIDGAWEAPAGEGATAVCDANTGEALFQQGESSAAQVERAVALAAATHADNAWLQRSLGERADDLRRVAEEILARGEAIARADAQTTGVVISLTEKLVQLCAGAFRQATKPAFDTWAAKVGPDLVALFQETISAGDKPILSFTSVIMRVKR